MHVPHEAFQASATLPDERQRIKDDGATLDDLREAMTTLEDSERIARRVLGSSHPRTQDLEETLQEARACFLRAREELGLA